MSGPPRLLLHLNQNFQVMVKDVRNIHSRCGYIKTLENCYIPDFKVLYSKSSTFATSTKPKSSCWGERCTKKYFLFRMYYLPSPPLLLLHLSKKLQAGMKDVPNLSINDYLPTQ